MRKLFIDLTKILVPVLLAISTTSNKPARATGWKKYSVYFFDASYYYVSEEISDMEPGLDYLCVYSEGTICAVESFMTPDGYMRIPISYGWPVYTNSYFLSLDY